MRAHISQYAEKVAPLQNLLAEVIAKVGSPKKATSQVDLTPLWGNEHESCFRSMQAQVLDMTVMAYPDPAKALCLFTDASEQFLGAVLTQIPKADLDLPVEEQKHEPLAFSSGAFKGPQLRWSVPEKEGFAIVQAVTSLDYILLRFEVFHILTDHRNLQYIYNPRSIDHALARHTVAKLQALYWKTESFNAHPEGGR